VVSTATISDGVVTCTDASFASFHCIVTKKLDKVSCFSQAAQVILAVPFISFLFVYYGCALWALEMYSVM
jgi:hypothetical protein